jgi:hypothetical protein
MHRPHVLSAAALALCLCACDSRKDFAGTYEVSGVLSIREGTQEKTSEVKEVPLVIIADAFDSDRLYLDFDCGLSATMRDGESFDLDGKTCPSYTRESCTFTWIFNTGVGTLKEESALDFDSSGLIKGRCSNGSSGMVPFSFRLTGVRKSVSEPDAAPPGEQSQDTRSRQMSALRAAVVQAMRPHLQ